ncbi:MAG: hypothetical protein HYW09_01485 [Candidatus Niyogibacteria bacterium]|nr:hypothetical protein [Candidatus Niyogibacteria bacterium]
MPLIIFIVFAVLGISGIVFLVARRVVSNRLLSEDERKAKIAALPMFFDFIREDVLNPLDEFSSGVIQPQLFKLSEKSLRRFRILVLRMESILHRMSDHFRGRRIAIKNGSTPAHNGSAITKNSDFWNEMHEAKNGLKNGGDKNETKDLQK